MQTQQLIATKLCHPQIRQRHVARPRLLQLLEQVSDHRLTLICAPAGSGKTTLLSEWLTSTSLPVVWVALDKEDNDATRFWSYISAAEHASPWYRSTFARLSPRVLVTIYSFRRNILCDASRCLDENHLACCHCPR